MNSWAQNPAAASEPNNNNNLRKLALIQLDYNLF